MIIFWTFKVGYAKVECNKSAAKASHTSEVNLKHAQDLALSNVANEDVNQASHTSVVVNDSEETKLTSDFVNLSKKKIDGNLQTCRIASFVDLVDLSTHNCCGYCYVLHLVDPLVRFRHVTALKSYSEDYFCRGLSKLMGVACYPPTTIYYDAKHIFVPTVASLYPHVSFARQPHSDVMVKERQLYLKQLRKWRFYFANNSLHGVTVGQAVTNMLNFE